MKRVVTAMRSVTTTCRQSAGARDSSAERKRRPLGGFVRSTPIKPTTLAGTVAGTTSHSFQPISPCSTRIWSIRTAWQPRFTQFHRHFALIEFPWTTIHCYQFCRVFRTWFGQIFFISVFLGLPSCYWTSPTSFSLCHPYLVIFSLPRLEFQLFLMKQGLFFGYRWFLWNETKQLFIDGILARMDHLLKLKQLRKKRTTGTSCRVFIFVWSNLVLRLV